MEANANFASANRRIRVGFARFGAQHAVAVFLLFSHNVEFLISAPT